MKKITRFLVPFIAAYLLLGFLINFVERNNRADAASTQLAKEVKILVTTLEDEMNMDGNCSLREAIEAANYNTPVDACPAGDVLTDTINFNVVGTIYLATALAIENNGIVFVNGNESIAFNGGGISRAFIVQPDAQLMIEGITLENCSGVQGGAITNFGTLVVSDTLITGSRATSTGGGIHNFELSIIINSTISGNRAGQSYYSGGSGGGIYNGLYSTLVIFNSVVSGNDIIGEFSDGGGIDNHGEIIVEYSEIYSNSASYMGGGISSYYGPAYIADSILYGNQALLAAGILNDYGPMEIYSSTISGNNAVWSGGGGGGISNGDVMTITNTTISGNHAGNGGGVDSVARLTINKSTISGNTADYNGGGISNIGKLSLTNSTLSGNTAAGYGGGINNSSLMTMTFSTLASNVANIEGGGLYRSPSAPKAAVSNSIIAYSLIGGNCGNDPIMDGGHNIEDMNSCSLNPLNGSMLNTDPLLGFLQDNGGPTWTHALLPGSPAIDAIEKMLRVNTDQRGLYRPMDGDNDGSTGYDIGSFELEGPILFMNPRFFPFVSK